MDKENKSDKVQKIIVFEQNNSGENKIQAISKYAKDLIELKRYSIDEDLPPLINDSTEYFPKDLDADLVINYLKHPDLSEDLSLICKKKNIPVVASRKKIKVKGTLIPPTCCGLSRHNSLGNYGELFGAPEYEVELEDGKIKALKTVRGAPCGATWDAAKQQIGLDIEEAIIHIGLSTQFFCKADPSDWDPIFGKSPVHFAADIHSAALERAYKKLKNNQ